MKKTKKYLLSVIIGVVFLLGITTCTNDIDKSINAKNTGTEYGRLTITLQHSATRTIMPVAVTLNELTFDITLSRDGYDNVTRTNQSYGSGIEIDELLATGNWSVKVDGKKGGNTLFSRTNTVNIGTGTNSVTVTLNPLKAGAGTLDFTLSYPIGSIDEFVIEWRSELGGNSLDWPFVKTETDTQLTLKALEGEAKASIPSGTYYLTIRLIKEGKTIGRVQEVVLILDHQLSSKTITIEENDLSSPPSAPTAVTIDEYIRDSVTQQLTGIKISWTTDSYINDGFRIERKKNYDGAWTPLNTEENYTDLNFTDDVSEFLPPLSAGDVIFYRVWAYNNFGDSDIREEYTPTLRALIYNGNAQTTGTPPSNILYFPNESVTLLANTGLTKNFHDFDGWSETTNGEEITTLTISDADKTVFARWVHHFGGGDGTAGDPFQIQTVAHLEKMRDYVGTNHPGKHFKLMDDLDLVDVENWTPIGSDPINAFQGVFDGNGKTIYNLTINDNANNNKGLFGYIQTATIKNLMLTEVDIVGSNQVGGLAGYAMSSNIENCGVITEAYKFITGVNYVGGLVGLSSGLSGSETNIKKSFSQAVVKGWSYSGGLIGEADYSTIENSYSTGEFTEKFPNSHTIGGFIGQLDNGTVTNCYSVSKVTLQTGATVYGAFIGSIFNSDILNSFYNTDINGDMLGISSSGGSNTSNLTGKNTATMVQQSTFTGANWDFGEAPTDYWNIENGSTYPYLQWQMEANKPLPVVIGEGTEVNPYKIYTVENLKSLNTDFLGAEYAGNHFKLMNDLDLSNEANWVPIGSDATNSFRGIFDGDGKTISNLKTTDTYANRGLFGYVSGATIKKLKLTNVNISSGDNSGGLIGAVAGTSIIEDCSLGGVIVATGDYIGGLVGQVVASSQLTIQKSMTNIDISVTGTKNSFGGLIGHIINTVGSVTIEESYSIAKIRGNTIMGGLIGTANKTTITNSYSIVDIVSTGNTIGGLIGSMGTVVNLTNCYSAAHFLYSTTDGATAIFGIGAGTIPSNSNIFYDKNRDSHGVVHQVQARQQPKCCRKAHLPAGILMKQPASGR